MDAVKEVFTVIGVVAGGLTAVITLTLTVLDLRKRLALRNAIPQVDIHPPSATPARPPSAGIVTRAALQFPGVGLIAAGVLFIGDQIVNPSPEQVAALRRDITAGGSGSTVSHGVVTWPAALAFLLGTALWREGRAK